MFGAIVLAGGAARRLSGRPKPNMTVAGVALLTRVLSALDDASPVVVVGPPALSPLLPPGVALTQEQPTGTGPVAALAAGLAFLDSGERPPAQVALLASDLPFLTSSALGQLAAALHAAPSHAGAVFADAEGRPQWLCGLWRAQSLRTSIAELGQPANRGVGELTRTLPVLLLSPAETPMPPWFDCDTDEALDYARHALETELPIAPPENRTQDGKP